MSDIEAACQRLSSGDRTCNCEGENSEEYYVCGPCRDLRAVIAAARQTLAHSHSSKCVNTYPDCDLDAVIHEAVAAERQAYAVLHAWSDQSIAREKNLEAERDALKAKAERLEARVALLEGECGVLEANLFALEHSLTKARVTELEAALRKYGEHYEGCHGGHRCHCGLSAALGGEK